MNDEEEMAPGDLKSQLVPPLHSEPMTSLEERRFGELLIKEGLITEAQLQEALQFQKELKWYKPVGQILAEKKLITASQLNFFLDRDHKRPRLGEILLKTGAITREQFYIALGHQKKTGRRFGETLRDLGYVTDEVLRQALSTQLNIPFVDLDKLSIDRSLARLINKSYAKKNLVVPIAKTGNAITIAMEDPTAVAVIEELQSFAGFTINVVTSSQGAIERAFTRVYGEDRQGEAESSDRLELIAQEQPDTPDQVKLDEDAQQMQADDIVRALISVATNSRATDIHLETVHNQLFTRFRIDGVLQNPPLGSLEKDIKKNSRAIISRIKILGQLDIAERRRPQDGSFRARVERDGKIEDTDFRISIIPSYYGENAVIRVLDPRNAPHSVHELGFSKPITDKLLQLLQRPSGTILIVGPTGSGKSTTLYGAMMNIYRPGIKILTAEDPIEYVHEGITQCEVNEKIGNTFAAYLRAFLRHDPQVIMLGEIRDPESAELATRASLTGHLLLSTLHTKDAVSSIVRLFDLKIDTGMITSSLLGVLAQRLVRTTCSECKEEYQPSEELLKEFFSVPPSSLHWYKGKGCRHCNFTGYKGRMPVAELWVPNPTDIILINKGAPIDEIRASSYQSTIPMAEDVKERLRQGRTNLEELIRTLPYSSVYQFRRVSF
jgi:type IV pilus assembly protein PilB